MNDHASKLKGLMWLLLPCFLGIALVLGLAPLAHLIPWHWEKKLADILPTHTQKQACSDNAQAQLLLQQLVTHIYPLYPTDTDFSINVLVQKNTTINAYATLGGTILVHSELLEQAESPEELAGVLAHEIGHIAHRHIMESIITRLFTAEGFEMIWGSQSSTAQWWEHFLAMSFTRSQETEADKAGLYRLQKAHIDNRGFKHFFERMEKKNPWLLFCQTTPPTTLA